MRWWAFFLTLPLIAAPLPVHYDPFVKAKRIIKRAKEPILSSVKMESPHFELSAIFNDKAFINGRFYKIGDRIWGYRVSEIKENYVILQKNGTKVIVPLVKKHVLGMAKE